MIFIIFFLVFCFTAMMTLLVRHFAISKNILDIPNDRSSHEVPTPRGGGLAIVVAFTITVLMMSFMNRLDIHLSHALVGGGLLIAAIGYADDVYRVRTVVRIAVHFIAAIWAVYWLDGFPQLSVGAWNFHLHDFGSILAVIAIVWSINLYNFMDGIDGLAGSEGLFIALAGSMALVFAHHANTAILLYLLAAAIGGFTILNWPPAKIFLGDAGSGFLGYVFAVVAINTVNQHTLPLMFWLIIMALFICDATFTLLYRASQGKKWYAAHREHAYQRLITTGASHKQVTSGLMLFNFLIIFPLALLAIYWPLDSFWFFCIVVAILFFSWLSIKFRTQACYP
jgi:Fuc2NAc and GlcNAc transferase